MGKEQVGFKPTPAWKAAAAKTSTGAPACADCVHYAGDIPNPTVAETATAEQKDAARGAPTRAGLCNRPRTDPTPIKDFVHGTTAPQKAKVISAALERNLAVTPSQPAACGHVGFFFEPKTTGT